MKRKIIVIDDSKCNGCGTCVSACDEGALQLVNGKARVVKEQFCDGFGDCLGHCPTGALTLEERDTAAFDMSATRSHVLQERGQAGVARLDTAAQRHDAPSAAARHPPHPSGCPGTRAMALRTTAAASTSTPTDVSAVPGGVLRSDLEQWPVQIHLVPTQAPFFKNRELVVLSTCAPVASADIHWRFLRGRSVAVGCPKLDNTEGYAEKLGAILSEPSIPKVMVVRMEVPCCGGLSAIVREAVQLSGRTDLVMEEIIVGRDGAVHANAETPTTQKPN